MEEEKQAPIPLKTNIAVWWMMLVGIGVIILAVGTFIVCVLSFASEVSPGPTIFLLPFSIFLSGGFICFFNLRILKRKKWAWWVNLIIFSILFWGWMWRSIEELRGPSVPISEDIFGYIVFSFVPFIVLSVPLILLLLDRKNFWKIAS